MIAIIAAIGLGVFVAGIGAWKDSVWEPFRALTFMRSPLVAGLWGSVLGILYKSSDWLLVALAAIALERFTIETWKAILRKKPAKFKSPERDSRWLGERLRKIMTAVASRRRERRVSARAMDFVGGTAVRRAARRGRIGPATTKSLASRASDHLVGVE